MVELSGIHFQPSLPPSPPFLPTQNEGGEQWRCLTALLRDHRESECWDDAALKRQEKVLSSYLIYVRSSRRYRVRTGDDSYSNIHRVGARKKRYIRYAPKKTSRCRLMKRNGTGRLMKRNGPFTIRSSSVRGPCVFSVRFESVLI